MAINPLKAFLFAAGGTVAAAGTAYVSGALDPYLGRTPPAEVTALTPPAAPTPADPGTEARLPAVAVPAAPAAAPQTTAPAAPAAGPIAPTFDVVRVEGNGSIVIAGNAAPNSKVEILNGTIVLGSTVAGADGAFVIVLDDPLKPGDYTIALRSTTGDIVTASAQTAVVSVPANAAGQVLAMVEEPGKPAELLTVPAPGAKPAAPAAGDQAATPAAEAPAATTQAPAAVEAAPAVTAPATPPGALAEPKIVVEAVEIDGSKIFVAGLADPGRKVRAYADDLLLGDARTSPDGHFLVEATRNIPVGSYTIRVDGLDSDGVKVVARAAVPFEREPGESVAAVAATTPPSDVPDTVAPKLEHADSAVIIRRHDTLWRISRRVYGYGVRYSTIYLANQDQITDPDRIWPGQVFKIPEKSKEGEAADLKAMGEQATTAPTKTQ